MMRRRIIVLLCFSLYIGSYATISRMGMSRTDNVGVGGYYLVTPDSELTAMLNCACVVVYSPLIVIEDLCGTAEPPLRGIPLFQMSGTAGDPSGVTPRPLTASAVEAPP